MNLLLHLKILLRYLMNKKLLFSLTKKDFKIDTMKGHGPGGQHRNTTNSAVRVTHKESGAQGYSQDERSQKSNKNFAFKRCVSTIKFKKWLNAKVFEIEYGEAVELAVNEAMKPENILEEVKDEKGKWVENGKGN